MTPQTLMHIDFTEIPAITITCKNCGSCVSLKLPHTAAIDTTNCMGCNTLFWNKEDKNYLLVLALLRQIGVWKERAPDARFNLGFAICSP